MTKKEESEEKSTKIMENKEAKNCVNLDVESHCVAQLNTRGTISRVSISLGHHSPSLHHNHWLSKLERGYDVIECTESYVRWR